MDLIVPMVAVVLSFPPAIMIVMLAMNRVERRVARHGVGGPPPLRLVHGESGTPSGGAAASGGTAARAPDGRVTPTAAASPQPRRTLRLVPTEKTTQNSTKTKST